MQLRKLGLFMLITPSFYCFLCRLLVHCDRTVRACTSTSVVSCLDCGGRGGWCNITVNGCARVLPDSDPHKSPASTCNLYCQAQVQLQLSTHRCRTAHMYYMQ